MAIIRNLCLLVTLVVATTGCESKQADSDPSPSTNSQYILTSEPADAKTPTDIKESVTQPTLISLAGRIEAGDVEPFQAGLASFMISQLPDATHAGGDPEHAENCPFCKRKLKNAPKAVVRFLNDTGEVLAVDSRELLGVSKGDIVVVRGVATYLEPVNTVQIDAEGIFVR